MAAKTVSLVGVKLQTIVWQEHSRARRDAARMPPRGGSSRSTSAISGHSGPASRSTSFRFAAS